jgi:hypothetical protein
MGTRNFTGADKAYDAEDFVNGSIKTVAGQEKTSFRGRDRVAWAFTFAAAA